MLRAANAYVNIKANDPMLGLITLFPSLVWLLDPIRQGFWHMMLLLGGDKTRWLPASFITRFIMKLVAQRKKDGIVRQDFLQAAMDSRDPDDPSKPAFDEMEIGVNGTFLYMSGFETSTTPMSYIAHYLVNDPQLQERMRAEVQELVDRDGSLGHNVLAELPLMDSVMKEVLRLHPPVTQFITREAIEDYTYTPPPPEPGQKPGKTPALKIPKGTAFVVNVKELHYDPAYWTKPQEFNPERFMDDGKGGKPHFNPIVYQPFGTGPRYCPGQRFAALMAKYAWANVLMRYRVVPCSKTEIGNVTSMETLFLLRPASGVLVNLERL
jgi:cytochrome P450